MTMQWTGRRGRSDGSTGVHLDESPFYRAHQTGTGTRGSDRPKTMDERLARMLGWFSIGLGIAQLMMPRKFTKFIGVKDTGTAVTLTRVVGFREIMSGVGILSQKRPLGWVWARVAGDAMDIMLLQSAASSGNVHSGSRLASTMMTVAGITVTDVLDAVMLTKNVKPKTRQHDENGGSLVTSAITVRRSPEQVYEFWRDFRNLPRFMENLESVQILDDRRTHWVAKGPGGKRVEWDAETTEDRPGELIAWRSLPGADVQHSGVVRFRRAPGNRGTEITVEMTYEPPAGGLGKTFAKLFGREPQQQVDSDLRRLKQVLETGEVIVSDGSLGGLQYPQRPAQPPAEEELRTLMSSR